MASTYNNLYMDIRQQLRLAGIRASTLEARELVCFAAGKTRQWEREPKVRTLA